ncbi:NifU family protein [Methylocystis bryophila]|uniref:NifU family protein n=1 Tax=Methylocystis bryophila TaxID=655015 RepID=A0A1W6N1N4_9HYPH|nr:NifU family protein [Methylocystis bryophila]ARN83780.1 NifU family protein [Methylocystis bryophila]BDV38974.1 iron transporter [Methylocystis bryophila]
MFIQTETTPNPSTLKFLPGCVVLPAGAREFRTRESAACAPLVEALFELAGVEAVMLGSDFVSVTKGDVDWAHLKPAALGLIMMHFSSGEPLFREGDESAEGTSEFFDPADAPVVETIKNLIETRVRPAVARDGGDITFRGLRDGVVYLSMKGACSGCPSSAATLKSGVENLLRHYVPQVRAVEQA